MQDQYWLAVEGERGPKRPHPTMESVMREAKRLHAKHNGHREIYVLQTVNVIGRNPTEQPVVQRVAALPQPQPSKTIRLPSGRSVQVSVRNGRRASGT